MARFDIYSKDGQSVRYSGKMKFLGTYMKPGMLEFREVSSPTPIDFMAGDYVVYPRTGYTYRIYNVPQVKKQARRNEYGGAFVYQNVQLFDASKMLEYCPFRDLVAGDNRIHFSTQPSISTFEGVDGIARRIQACLDDMYPNTWVVRLATTEMGASQDLVDLMAEAREFTVSGVSLLGALDKIYEVWPEVGWTFSYDSNTGKNILTIGGAGLNQAQSYQYGKGNGLKSITRTVANADEIATRIFAYGSSRNMLPRWYNSQTIKDADSVDIQNLMLPVNPVGTQGQSGYYPGWGKTLDNGVMKPDPAKAFLDASSAVMTRLGLRPKTYYFDGTGDLPEIYPTIREMTIKDVRDSKSSSSDPYYPKATVYTDENARVDTILSAPSSFDSGLPGETSGIANLETETLPINASNTFTQLAGLTYYPFYHYQGEWTPGRAGTVALSLSLDLGGSVQLDGIESVTVSVRIKHPSYQGNTVFGREYELRRDGANSVSLSGIEFETDKIRVDDVTYDVYVDLAVSNAAQQTDKTGTFSVNGGFAFTLENSRTKTFKVGIRQIGFNINEQANLGEGKTIAMRSGKCAGRSFVIKSCAYVESTDSWSLEVIRSNDESLSQWFPNSSYPIAVDDEFVLLDIAMPDEYILVAEKRLLAAAQELLADVSVERWQYTPEIDAKFMVENNRSLLPAQNMQLVDANIVENGSVAILIDTVTINEGEAAIPTYKVTLRDRKKKTFTESKGADSMSSNPVTNSTNNASSNMSTQESYFTLDAAGNVTLKEAYNNLWVPGWLSAGGIGTGGGGGGGGLITLVKSVTDLGIPIATESLTETFSAKAIESIYEAVVALQQSTPNVSLTNGSTYSSLTVNGTSVDFYTKTQVDSLIQNIDLSDYVTNSALNTTLAGYMQKVTSTDNAVVRFNGTGGAVQNSGVVIDDNNNMKLPSGTSATFANNPKLVIGRAWLGTNTSGSLAYGTVSGSTYSAYYTFESTQFRPATGKSNAIDIGTSSLLFKDIYLAGGIKNGTNTLTIPSKTGTIAVTSDIPGYALGTPLAATAAKGTMLGVNAISNDLSSSGSESSLIKWENGAWHFYGNIYADGWISAGGVGSGGGGGGGLIETVYGVTDLGSIYTEGGTDDHTTTFSAFAIDKVWQRVQDTYTIAQVNALLDSVNSFEYVVANSLPTAGVSTMYKIYLIPSSNPQTQNVKDEFITIYDGTNYVWEQFGTTSVDLSNYVTNTALAAWTGSSNITTVGSISSGTWGGTAIGVTKGGTGLTSITKGQILYASANNTIATLNANGTSTKKFLSQTSNNAPAWSTLEGSDIPDLSGTYLPLSGGTVTGRVNFKDIIGYDVANDNGWWIADDNTAGGFSEIDTACIYIGPVKIVYDSNSTALHITTHVTGANAPVIGLYVDGFVASGGVGSGGGSSSQSLSGLVDTDINETLQLFDGDLLVYNSTTSHWQNMRQSSIVPSISVVVPSSGNALTGASVSGGTITFTKGSFVQSTDFALSNLSGADDLKAIEALTGTSGLLKKTAANTWTLDTTTYLTASDLSGYLPLTGGTLTGALTITPSTNVATTSNGLDFGSSSLGTLAHFGSATSGLLGIYSKGNIYIRPGDGTAISSSYGIQLTPIEFNYNGNAVYHAGNLTPMRRTVLSTQAKRAYFKVKINNTGQWMGSFTVKIYSNYHFEVYEVSGYNYQTGWYSPKARLVMSTTRASVNVKFGYDGSDELWFLIPTIDDSTSRTHGIEIFGFCGTRGSGKYLVEDADFTCSTLATSDDITGTVQTTSTINNVLTGSTGVRLDTDQEITGNKTFSSGLITIKTGTSGTPTLLFQRGTASDNYVDWKIQSNAGALNFIYSTGGTDTGKITFSNNNLRPHADTVTDTISSLTLGTESQQWGGLYSTTGTFSSAVTSASLTTGDLIIKTGTSGTPTLTFLRGTASDTSVDWKLISNGGHFYIDRSTNGTQTNLFDIYTTGITPVGTVTDSVSNLILGSSANRWATIYGAAGDFSTTLTVGGDTSIGGNLTIPTSKYVKVGDAYLEYDSTNHALRVYGTYTSGNDTLNIGLYCDGFVAAGGADSGSGSSVALESLSDVTISSPHSGGDLLVYNGTTHHWENKPQSQIVPSLSVVVPSTGNALTGVTASGATLTFTTGTFLTAETDPVFAASVAAGISANDITNWNGKTSNTGTVTSVKIEAGTGIAVSSSSAITTSGTRTISISSAYQTKISNGDSAYTTLTTSRNAGLVLASPASGSGAPSFRALVASDIPDLSSTYLTSESDPVFTASVAHGITSSDISNWNGKADASALDDYALKTGANTYNFQVASLIFSNGTVSPYANAVGEKRLKFEYLDVSQLVPTTVTKVIAYTSDIPTAASLGAVTLADAQTITGSKTFNANMVMGADIYPSTDLGASLGYSDHRFLNGHIQTVNSTTLYLKNGTTGNNSGMLTATSGYVILRTGANIGSSYKQLSFHETYGFYPEQSINLGYNSANGRWANIYGVSADLSTSLSVPTITIGNATLSYDSTAKALHVSGTDNGVAVGFYADGWVAAGGVGTGGGGGITVDSALSSTSENPVQNKAIYAVIGDVESLLAAL